MVLTLSFLSSKLFIYVGLLSILAIYLFIFFFCHCGLFSLRFDEILSYQLHYHFLAGIF